jgi:hypothetical protein
LILLQSDYINLSININSETENNARIKSGIISYHERIKIPAHYQTVFSSGKCDAKSLPIRQKSNTVAPDARHYYDISLLTLETINGINFKGNFLL